MSYFALKNHFQFPFFLFMSLTCQPHKLNEQLFPLDVVYATRLTDTNLIITPILYMI